MTDGEIFQPWPSSRAGPAPVPSVAMPPLPFSPVKFSGLIERVSASARRQTFVRPTPSPFHVTSPVTRRSSTPNRGGPAERDLVVVESADDRLRVLLGVPTVDGGGVALVQDVDLQAEVVVQAACPVSLHDEAAGASPGF